MPNLFFRELREQVEARGFDDLDLGPDEHQLMMTDSQLHSSQQREISKLKKNLHHTKNELESLKIRVMTILAHVCKLQVYMY